METSIIAFRSFFFYNICIQCYKYPSKCCFHCISQILKSCMLIFNSLKYFKIFLEFFSFTHVLFDPCMLLTPQIFWDFMLLLISSLNLWSESIQCIIPILLHLSRCVLWPEMWSVLVNVPWKLEKNVHSAVGWNSL